MSAGTKGPVVNIYIFMLFISCRYANPDFDRLRMNRIRLNIYRERRNLCHATGANPVSPKLFGSCFVLCRRIGRACIIAYLGLVVCLACCVVLLKCGAVT